MCFRLQDVSGRWFGQDLFVWKAWIYGLELVATISVVLCLVISVHKSEDV
jgi:hypothetical protein